MAKIIQPYYVYVLVLLALVMPLHPRFVPPVIIAVGVLSLFLIEPAALIKNRVVWALAGFYLLHVIALLYTTNMAAGQFELEVKLSLIIFPIALLPVKNLSFDKIQWVYAFFIIGCFLAILICLHKAYWNYTYESWARDQNLYHLDIGINFFLSSRFSFFMHPAYFSAYLSIGLALLMFQPLAFLSRPAIRVCLAVIFVLAIVMLASKAGIIVLGLLMIYFFIKMKNRKLMLLLLALFLSAGTVLFLTSTEFANKFKNLLSVFNTSQVDSTTQESTGARVLIWSVATKSLAESPFIGHGPGDATDVLAEKYKQHGYTGVLEKELNAHNQFLQTGIELGAIGIMALLLIFYFAYKHFRSQQSGLGTILIIIFVVNFLVEVMLDRQAGVVLFSFWLLFEAYKPGHRYTDN